eukprot:14138759-Ditylum_brightwellii.AAC.1
MSVLVNLIKHYKSKDADSSSSFDPPAIPFIPRALSLKMENTQEFTLRASLTKKKSIYKYKAITFCNGSPEGILEWEKKLSKVIKNKPVDTADGRFDLVKALLEGDALTHWQEFKRVEMSCTSKNPNSTDTAPLGACNDTFKACLQELKKHYFPKNSTRLQEAYLHNHIWKPSKLSIKNTTARLWDVNGMLARFPAPDNRPMADDELCNILNQMVNHK